MFDARSMALMTSVLRKHRDTLESFVFQGIYNSSFISFFLIFIQTLDSTDYVMSEVTEALKGSPILSEVWIPGMKQEERTTEW